MRSATLLLALMCVLFLSLGAAQKNNYPTPPEPLNKDDQASQSTAAPIHHIDMVRVQQEADDLARTAQTIPSDLVSVRKGMLPRDTIKKLKQIEKLSKRLRTELTP